MKMKGTNRQTDGRMDKQTDGRTEAEREAAEIGQARGRTCFCEKQKFFFLFFWTNSVHALDMAPLGTYVNSGTNRQTDKQADVEK